MVKDRHARFIIQNPDLVLIIGTKFLILTIVSSIMAIDRIVFPWEVFDSKDGITLGTFSFKWQARLFSLPHGLDYAKRDEGWL